MTPAACGWSSGALARCSGGTRLGQTPGPHAILGDVGAARDIIDRARNAGLPPELAEQLERRLVPRLEDFLAGVPERPPATDAEEVALINGLFEAYRPCWPAIVQAFGLLADAMSGSLEDLQSPELQADVARRPALHHLEEAACSLVRVAMVATALTSRLPTEELEVADSLDLDELPDAHRTYLRGLLALLVAFDRLHGELEGLVAWTWTARRELLKSEALILVELQQAATRTTEHTSRHLEGDQSARSLVERGELHLGQRPTNHPPRPTGVALSPAVVGQLLDELRGDR